MAVVNLKYVLKRKPDEGVNFSQEIKVTTDVRAYPSEKSSHARGF